MPWIMEVKVGTGDKDGATEWRAVRPSGGEPRYEYESEEEAYRMIRICYPMVSGRRVRFSERTERSGNAEVQELRS